MAFTNQTKFEILHLLGYPAKTIVPTSTCYSNIINDRLNDYPQEAESVVQDILGKIRKLNTRIEESYDRYSTKKVDDIELRDNERGLLNAEKSRLVKELSSLMDIPYKGNSRMFGVVV